MLERGGGGEGVDMCMVSEPAVPICGEAESEPGNRWTREPSDPPVPGSILEFKKRRSKATKIYIFFH